MLLGQVGEDKSTLIRLEHNTTKQALNTANLSDVSNLKPSQLLPLIRSSLVDSPSHNITTT